MKLSSIYCGEFVYDANLGVDYIITPVGQMTNNSGTFTPQFNITDHLGNVRSVVNSSGAILQSTDYYPFGLAFADNNLTTNRYLFNGKELENYTLGTTYLGTLDYGARHYDPRIARWTVPDPMSEKYYGISGYVYCVNNPMRFVDLTGEFPILPFVIVIKTTGYLMEKHSVNAKIKTIGYGINHPIKAIKTGTANRPAWGISKTASNFEVNLRNKAGLRGGSEGDQGNAYRHAIWQAMLTNEFGENQAQRIGNAHEDNITTNMNQRYFAKKGLADQMVDLLNNEIGREIGKENKGTDNRKLAEAVLKEYRQNGLWIVSEDEKLGFKVEKTRLTQQEYEEALRVLQAIDNNGLLQ